MSNKKKAPYDANTKAAQINKMYGFGQQLRVFRKAKNLTQVELAKLLGGSEDNRGTISGIENGKKSLSFNRMIFICRQLGIDLKLSYEKLVENKRNISESTKQPKAPPRNDGHV